MGTATVVNEPTTDQSGMVDIKKENTEYRIYAHLNQDGTVKKRELVSVQDFEKWNEAHPDIKDNLELQQTITKYKVSSIAGLQTLIGDDEEAVNIINRGLAAKFSQKLNSNLLETNDQGQLVFTPVEGAFDSLEWLQEETVRKNLSPMEKVQRDIKKNLAALSQDDMANIQAMLAQLMAGQG